MEYSEARGRYLIVAGPFDDNGTFALYSWSGKAGDDAMPVPEAVFSGLKPEAMLVYPGEAKAVQFLSDDGGEKVGAVDCKDAPVAAQRFRAFSLNVP